VYYSKLKDNIDRLNKLLELIDQIITSTEDFIKDSESKFSNKISEFQALQLKKDSILF
jgi:hypothetical protein